MSPDPSDGPSSWEILSTIRRTLHLPVVAQYRQVLQPEFGVFQLRLADRNEMVGRAGIVDAIAYNLVGAPELVFDWKSDVAPTADTRQHHALKFANIWIARKQHVGLVVYMTTGEVQEVAKGSLVGGVFAVRFALTNAEFVLLPEFSGTSLIFLGHKVTGQCRALTLGFSPTPSL